MAQQPRDYLKPALWLMGAILVMGAGIGTHNQWERVEAEVIALIPDTVDGYELQRSNLIHERRKDFLSGVGTAATIVGGVGLFLNLRLQNGGSPSIRRRFSKMPSKQKPA
jgi:hypothetical protein